MELFSQVVDGLRKTTHGGLLGGAVGWVSDSWFRLES